MVDPERDEVVNLPAGVLTLWGLVIAVHLWGGLGGSVEEGVDPSRFGGSAITVPIASYRIKL